MKATPTAKPMNQKAEIGRGAHSMTPCAERLAVPFEVRRLVNRNSRRKYDRSNVSFDDAPRLY